MKFNYHRLLILGGLLVLALNGCKDSETETDATYAALAHTWQLTSARLDNVGQSSYEDFQLTMSGSDASATYITIGRPDNSPWPGSGKWTLGEPSSSKIVRDPGTADELAMTYSLSGSTLTVSFIFSGEGYAGGRVNSAEGNWEFEFERD